VCQCGTQIRVKRVEQIARIATCEQHDRLLVVGGARLLLAANRAVGGDNAKAFLLATIVPGGGPAAERVGF
jgi:hypothetical protein